MRNKGLSVIFDCGSVGRVTWEVPSQFLSGSLTDAELVVVLQLGLGPSIQKTFRLFALMLATGKPALIEFGYTLLDSHIKEIARQIAMRSQ